MGREEYRTTVSYMPIERREAPPARAGEEPEAPSVGEAIVVVSATFIFAAAAMVLILILGALGWMAFNRRWLDDEAFWRLLQLSLVPWLIAAVKTLVSVWQSLRLPAVVKTYPTSVKVERAKDYHLIPVVQEATLDSVPVPHLVEFIQQLHVRGHNKRAWVDKFRFEDGWLCDYDTWHNCCQILVKADILRDWGPRRKGRLKTSDPEDIMGQLRVMKLIE